MEDSRALFENGIGKWNLPDSADSSPTVAPSRDGRSGDSTVLPDAISPSKTSQPPPGTTSKPTGYLSGQTVGPLGTSPFDSRAPAVPFAVNNPIAPAPPESFKDRYPMSSPIAPRGPDQLTPQPQSGSGPAPGSMRVLNSRFPGLNPGGIALGSSPSQRMPNPPAQTNWPPATRPLPDYAVPPSVYGLPDRDAGIMDDWFNRWIKPLFPQ
jgi:hypothetical protein